MNLLPDCSSPTPPFVFFEVCFFLHMRITVTKNKHRVIPPKTAATIISICVMFSIRSFSFFISSYCALKLLLSAGFGMHWKSLTPMQF